MRRNLALSLLGSAGLSLLLPHAAQGQTPEHVRLAGPFTEDLTALYYAVKSGKLAAAGIDLEMVPTSNGSAAVTAVIAGTYEMAKSSLLSVFAAHLRDIPIVLVSPEVAYSPKTPFAELQVATDSPIKSGTDLNGKTVGIPALKDLNELAVSAWSDKNGGDWKSLKFVELPNATMEAALQQHRIDAAMMQPPQLDSSLAAGTTKTIGDGYGAISSRFAVGAFIARRDWAATHGPWLTKFNRVVGTANEYVNTHPLQTIQYVSDLTKIPLEQTVKMHRSFIPPTLDPTTVQALIDAAAKYGLIARGFSAREIMWG
jgi:NitT/TauT family transport system substrate-binding protein